LIYDSLPESSVTVFYSFDAGYFEARR